MMSAFRRFSGPFSIESPNRKQSFERIDERRLRGPRRTVVRRRERQDHGLAVVMQPKNLPLPLLRRIREAEQHRIHLVGSALLHLDFQLFPESLVFVAYVIAKAHKQKLRPQSG